jgi:hypothetical protein
MFRKEIFSTFDEFILNNKIYLGDNSMFDVCEKDTIVFNLPIEFPSVLEMCNMSQSWQKICYSLVS